MGHTRAIVTHAKRALLLLAAASLAACTSSTAGDSSAPLISLAAPSVAVVVPSVAPTAETTPSAAASASEAAAESEGPTPVPTTIDPCQVVTADEASTLTGVKLGPGSPTTGSNNAKLCSYGSAQGGLVFNVIVAASPDAATAKAQEPAFKTLIEQGAAKAGLADMKLTEITDFQPGVDAAVLSGSTTFAGKKIEGVALYALKNAVLLAITDLTTSGAAPSVTDLEAEAKTALDRLP